MSNWFLSQKSTERYLCEMLDWPGVTAKSECICNLLTAVCVYRNRKSSYLRWQDLETKFGMFASRWSEFFWEHVELCIEKYEYVLTMHWKFLRRRTPLYADVIKMNGLLLHSLMGFIDCTKIRTRRSRGPGRNQQAVFLGHKRTHCLACQAIGTPKGLVFSLFA